MDKRKKGLAAAAKKSLFCYLTAFLVLIQLFLPNIAMAKTQQANETTGYLQITGSDRYKTSVAISQNGWSSSQNVVLVRGDELSDALCAGPLAKKYEAPILLTQSKKLNLDTLNEIKRLGAKRVIILGGVKAVSQNIADKLKSEGIANIERISGADRFETSVKIAEKLGNVDKVAVASASNITDALSFSSIAASKGIPILLTNKNNIPNSVKGYLSGKKITQSYIIGGTGSISSKVNNSVSKPVRLCGLDKFKTNADILKSFSDDFNYDKLYLAALDGSKGDGFAAALSGTALSAKTNSPILLIYKSISDSTKEYIKAKFTSDSKVITLGGQSILPLSLVNNILEFRKQKPVGAVYDKAQTYGPTTGEDIVSGTAVVTSADVTLKNITINGDLLLGKEIGNGNVYLNNVTVKGKTIVNGGGPNSIVLNNFNCGQVIVDIPDGHIVRLLAEGNTSVNSVSMNTSGKLEESNVFGNGFIDVIVPTKSTVTLDGSFRNVDVKANEASVDVNNGQVNTLTIAKTASNVSINLAKDTKVKALNINSAASIKGKGTIENAIINASGATLEGKPNNIENPNKFDITIGTASNAGKEEAGNSGNYGPGSGNGPGNGNAALNFGGVYLQATGESIEGSKLIPINPTFRLTFDRGVVRDYWSINQSCIRMTASGKDVPVSVSRIDGVDAEKKNIYVNPSITLTEGTEYNIIISGDITANNGNKLGSQRVITFTTAAKIGGGGSGIGSGTGGKDDNTNQEPKVEIDSANSAVEINPSLARNTTSKVTVTLKDSKGNLILNTTKNMKIVVTLTNNASTDETYMVNGTPVKIASGDNNNKITLTMENTKIDENGQYSFDVILPEVIDAGDGISVQVTQNNDTAIGNEFTYNEPVDQSSAAAALSVEGNRVKGNSIDINITDAKDANGAYLEGSINVAVISDKDGQVLNDSVSFAGGNATVKIPEGKINTAGENKLELKIEGVEAEATVTVMVVESVSTQMDSTKSTVNIYPAMTKGQTSRVTVTLRDVDNTLMSNTTKNLRVYVKITNDDLTTSEEYTVAGVKVINSGDNEVILTDSIIDFNGQYMFDVILPEVVDSGDGVLIQVTQKNGTLLGSEFKYLEQ